MRKKQNIPKVSICCLTYNHEPFIRKCLEGFMMQKTDFSFEILIHDDASTDGTPGIIREYEAKHPDIIKPIYQTENQASKGIKNTLIYQFPRVKGEYIAFCEGDDYWTDMYKLQKQVDFLDQNPDYTLCCHRYDTYDVEESRKEPEYFFYEEIFQNGRNGFTFDSNYNIKYWLTANHTVLIRTSAIDREPLLKYRYYVDVHLFYHILSKGKGYCMNFNGSVYNKHLGGVFSKKKNKFDIHYNIYKELYINNKHNNNLTEQYWLCLLRKVNSDVLKPETKLADLLRISLEPVFYGKSFTISYKALSRVLRDRLWRVKKTFLSALS